MGRNKKTYTDEFKKKCIQELMEGKTATEVCADNSYTLSDKGYGLGYDFQCSIVGIYHPCYKIKAIRWQ